MSIPVMDRETFYTGLLLSLAQTPLEKRDFPSEGEQLRDALRATLVAAGNAPKKVRVEGLDWKTVVNDHARLARCATDLIAFGQSSRLLSLLNVDLVSARVRVPSEDAREEMEDIGNAAWFQHLGNAFASEFTEA